MRDAKNALRGEDVREIFEAILPEETLRAIIAKTHFEERSRKRDAVAFLRAMVIAAGTGYGGRQRDVARIYFGNGAKQVARGGFYAWFGPELECAMNAIARRAIAYAASLELDTAQGFFFGPIPNNVIVEMIMRRAANGALAYEFIAPNPITGTCPSGLVQELDGGEYGAS